MATHDFADVAALLRHVTGSDSRQDSTAPADEHPEITVEITPHATIYTPTGDGASSVDHGPRVRVYAPTGDGDRLHLQRAEFADPTQYADIITELVERVLIAQRATRPGALAALGRATTDRLAADKAADAARRVQEEAIRQCFADDVPVAQMLPHAGGLTRARLYQIRDGRR